MKSKTSRLLFLQVGLIFLIIAALSAMFLQDILTVAANEVNTVIVTDKQEQSYEHVKYDLAGHDLVSGCCSIHEQIEGIQQQNATVRNYNTCNSISSSHGAGREIGYNANFLSGCGNWKGYSYQYGATDIPYYIDTATMTSARCDDIRAQAKLWNEVIMHDSTEKIVNLYEVNHTNNINDRSVTTVRQESMTESGSFNYKEMIIKLSQNNMKVDTPVHEFGHLLGLDDLDNMTTGSVHKALMGYGRETTEGTLERAIQYQDIQGIAVINGRHTNHIYTRYIKDGSSYHHFCFYCDIVNTQLSAISGSLSMDLASSCTHEYKSMVSARERLWVKCTKCYKVVEREFYSSDLSDGTVMFTGINVKLAEPLKIPPKIKGKAVTIISSNAFTGQIGITGVDVPASVTSIGTAFRNLSALKNITFENGSQLENIDSYAFDSCTALTEIIIPKNVLNIGYQAFRLCNKLNSVTIETGSKLASIGYYAFQFCINLTKISLPPSVINIYGNAFAYCTALTSVSFDNNSRLTNIGDSAFSSCSRLTGIIIPASVTSIGDYAFYDCTSLTIYSGAISQQIGWASNWNPNNRPVYFYSATSKANCWRYVDGVPTIWVPTYYKVTLNNQGGTGDTSYVMATYGLAMPFAAAPMRRDFPFAGYFSEPNGGGTQYYNADMESVHNYDYERDITLYAKWEGLYITNGSREFFIGGIGSSGGLGGKVDWIIGSDGSAILEGYIDTAYEYAWWFFDFSFTDFEILSISDEYCEVSMIDGYVLLFESQSYTVYYTIKLTGVMLLSDAEISEEYYDDIQSYGGYHLTLYNDGTAFVDFNLFLNGSFEVLFSNLSFEGYELVWINYEDCDVTVDGSRIIFETYEYYEVKCIIKLTGVTKIS